MKSRHAPADDDQDSDIVWCVLAMLKTFEFFFLSCLVFHAIITSYHHRLYDVALYLDEIHIRAMLLSRMR